VDLDGSDRASVEWRQTLDTAALGSAPNLSWRSRHRVVADALETRGVSRIQRVRIDLDPAAPMPYGMVDTGAEGGIPGGVCAPGEPVGSYVSFYVAVDDLEGSLRQAEGLGAKVAQRPTPPADGTRVAMFNDPEGHRIGLIQQATPQA
jgi:predicted enzyme related to lactoylglutathione lyase